MDDFQKYYHFILSNPALKSFFIIFLSIVGAKIIDVVFTIVFKKLVSKTETNLDDKIVYLLHRPIFYSIIFIGFIIAVKAANLSQYLDFAFVGIFKTLTIFIWFFVGSKILVISIDWASRRKANRLFQKNTLPLFNNLGKILVIK